jgi:hypothetical protein
MTAIYRRTENYQRDFLNSVLNKGIRQSILRSSSLNRYSYSVFFYVCIMYIRVSWMVRRLIRNRTISSERICKYCGWNMDEPDLEVLSFFHQDCWKNYRKEGLLYPMPRHV